MWIWSKTKQSCFHMKGFALGLALKMRRKATRKSPFVLTHFKTTNQIQPRCHVKVWLISSHVIGFSDLVDLWVIKIKKPMILCAFGTWRPSTKYRSHSENMQKVCLFFSQNNEFYDYQTWETFFLDIYDVRKGLWAFFLDCADWLGRQTLITWSEREESPSYQI